MINCVEPQKQSTGDLFNIGGVLSNQNAESNFSTTIAVSIFGQIFYSGDGHFSFLISGDFLLQ